MIRAAPAAVSVLRRLSSRVGGRALLGVTALTAALWAFLAIADEVGEGETRATDERILLALRTPGAPDDPVGPRWLEEAMRDVTALGGFTLLTLLTAVAVIALFRLGWRRQAAVFTLVAVGAQACSEALKAVYARPRPELVPHGSIVYSSSFPSGHSTLSAAVWLTLAVVLAGLTRRADSKALIFAVAVLVLVGVGASRVYLGVHWPSDVLAGWSLGAGWAFVGWVLMGGAAPGRDLSGEPTSSPAAAFPASSAAP